MPRISESPAQSMQAAQHRAAVSIDEGDQKRRHTILSRCLHVGLILEVPAFILGAMVHNSLRRCDAGCAMSGGAIVVLMGWSPLALLLVWTTLCALIGLFKADNERLSTLLGAAFTINLFVPISVYALAH